MKEVIYREHLPKSIRKVPTPFIKMGAFFMLPVVIVGALFEEKTAWHNIKAWWSFMHCKFVEVKK